MFENILFTLQGILASVFTLVSIAIPTQVEYTRSIQATTTIVQEYTLSTTTDPLGPEKPLPTVEPDPIATKPTPPEPEVIETIVIPVATPTVSLETINTTTLPALVNIFCGSTQGSTITGATGTGVIIDPRGVILTNAHVAQYLLLQNHSTAPVSCVIRTGAPAKPKYKAEILAFPSAWLENHAKDIRVESPTGTGEHDWALVYITKTLDGSPLPETYSFVPYDVQQGVAQTNDSVLLTGYPAGFLSGSTLQRNLWTASTIVNIKRVYTFKERSIDLLSLGGSIVAQGGVSGGAVINVWGNLVGIMVTSTTGETTDDRDLRALTLSHINTSILEHTGYELFDLLELGNFKERTDTFKANSIPTLLELYTI